MLFQQLKKNFLDMEFDEQLSFISDYIERRQIDLSKITVSINAAKAKKGTIVKKDKQLKLTSEQIKLLKQLGLV